ncbi:flagellar hook-associated protein FlgK [Angustibacter sp. McL0619]|uniref:flagellar hook-associated protein FlgK n=1 Tax=Angustibacter sp. McL0619 TaxID=3415676 RepID=UPI003CEE20C0
MSSTFSGLSTALNALMSQRAALTVTGQNIANANTVGYSRQRAELSAIVSSAKTGMTSGTAIGTNGGGVTVSSIRRLADAFVDARQRDAHSTSSYATAQSGALDTLEGILGEPSDNGLSAQLSDFWGAWQGLANTPDSVPARQALLSKAAAIVTTITHGRASIDGAFTDTRSQLDALATDVNSTSQSIADLNDQIRSLTAGGNTPNELIDQRDQLSLHLSELVGGRSFANDDGTVSISVNGVSVVTGTHAATLSVSGGGTIDTLASNPLQLAWSNGSTASFDSGQVAGTIDALTSTFVDAASSYDQIANVLATSVNAIHATGQDLDAVPTGDFFAGTTAKTLALAVTDPRKVGAAALAADGKPSLDASVADAMAALATSRTGPDVQWSSFVAATGVTTAQAHSNVSVRTAISSQSDANRASTSGVSLDEEMSNMLMFQRAYEGAGRMMTAIDEMLDTLINRTGQVGR